MRATVIHCCLSFLLLQQAFRRYCEDILVRSDADTWGLAVGYISLYFEKFESKVATMGACWKICEHFKPGVGGNRLPLSLYAEVSGKKCEAKFTGLDFV